MKKIEEQLIAQLSEKKYTISTAESCTGGMVAATIINVSGASRIFNEGYITYANASKHNILGVENEVLDTVGAVSAQCAKQMAEGCMKRAGANVGLATTGIAGPGGGTDRKPVGLVYIACCVNGETMIEKYIFKGNRTKVRKQAVEKVLELALKMLL